MEYIVPLVLIGAVSYFVFFRKGGMGGGCCGGGDHDTNTQQDRDGQRGDETGGTSRDPQKSPSRSCH